MQFLNFDAIELPLVQSSKQYGVSFASPNSDLMHTKYASILNHSTTQPFCFTYIADIRISYWFVFNIFADW